MFDSGKNKNKSRTGDGNGQDYSWPLQDEAAGLSHSESHESLKRLQAQSRPKINAGMKAFVDLQMALAAAELAFQYPHWDVIESAMTKFEDLRNGGFNELSEDEKNIAEQADREIYRLYQDKKMERRTTSPNVLEQHEVGNERVDHGANEGEDLRPKPTVALGARPKKRQRSPPSGNQREYEWPREDRGHAPKVPDWSDQYEPRCDSPRDRRFRSPKREEGPRTSHYHPRNSAYLEPKLEYPRSRNIDCIAQEPEYEAHEEFGDRERKNEAGMEQRKFIRQTMQVHTGRVILQRTGTR